MLYVCVYIGLYCQNINCDFVYRTPQYYAVKDIIEKYDPTNKELLMNTGVLPSVKSTKPIPLESYVLSETEKLVVESPLLRKILPDILPVAVPFVKALKNYEKGYIKIFGDTHYKNGFGFPPKPKNMELINMNYLKWLEMNDCLTLVPTILYTHSTQAYGLLHEIPAYYGLLWNRPDFLLEIINVSGRVERFFTGDVFQPLLSKGFGSVWDNVIKKDKIDIRLNCNILKINRHLDDENKRIQIIIAKNDDNIDEKSETNSDNVIIECDVLFMAINQKHSIELFDKISDDEKEVFGCIVSDTVYTTLYSSKKDTIKRQPMNIDGELWPNIVLKGDGQLYAHRQSLRAIKPELFDEKFNDNEMSVAYQYLNQQTLGTDEQKQEMSNLLIKNLENRGELNIKIHKQCYWEYFPKWKLNDIIKGYPWFVRDNMQGIIKNTYYIGSSISYESVLNVILYNYELLVQLGIIKLIQK